NGLYGLFYQKNIRKEKDIIIDNKLYENPAPISIIAGKLFNPIYATQITAETRINLFKTCEPYFKDTIAFATDSILFENDVEIETSDKLGDWDIHKKKGVTSRNLPTTVLKGGIYQIGKELKNRGIRKAKFINTPNGKFDNVFDYIKKCPNQTDYPIITERPLTFIEVLLHHLKHDVKDINVFTKMSYNIDLNKDYKRIWNDRFESGKELFEKSIDSTPLIMFE
ncbi:unnamed protein product, partial [marine sediment metagenome]